MNYSPLFDAALTFGLTGAVIAVGLKYVVDAIHWRRVAAMLRRGAMWGGK